MQFWNFLFSLLRLGLGLKLGFLGLITKYLQVFITKSLQITECAPSLFLTPNLTLTEALILIPQRSTGK